MPIFSRAQDIVAAQILLTLGDTEERRRYLNARATLKTLLDLGAVPVINENDTVATAEIRFGDNDRLAARVASHDGGRPAGAAVRCGRALHRRSHARCRRATHIPEVAAITPEIEAMAGESHFRRRARRHGVQADRRQDRDRRGLRRHHRQGQKRSSRSRPSRNGARHTRFPRQHHARRGAQALDRGRAEAAKARW